MSKKRKKKKKQYVDPYDVLEGRVNVTSDELIRLIHRVNPTTKGIHAEKESEGYKIKSRLQSLLIRKFSDRLLVERPDPGNPQLVGLKLRYFDEDACHALLPDLDPDARSWAQRQIDEALSPGVNETGEPLAAGRHRQFSGSRAVFGPVHENENGAAGKEEYSPAELIDRGRQALEEYDYDTCEDYFYRAFIMSQGGIEAAPTILEFYVDHLAAYEKALGLTDSLSAGARKNEEVKVMLALAAVRLGDIDRALDFLGSVRHPRAVEVYLLSARHFVTRENVDRAKELLAVLKSFEPEGLQPGIIQLENDIQGLRLKSFEPLEQEILFAWQQGEQEKAVKLAGQLLAEWPQSKIARRICDRFAGQQRADRLNLLLRRAGEAHAKAEFITEAELLKEAVALSKTDEGLRERFNRVQQAAKSQRDEAEIAETIRLRAAGCKKESLLHFVVLSDEQRREIMNRNQDEHFSRLSLIISAQSSLKPEKMVEAVLALGESEEILQKGGDPQTVVSILRHHSKVLQSIPAARDMLHRAQEMSKTLESVRAKERLKKAVDLAAVEDFQSARACIDEVKDDYLDEAGRKILADMNEKLERFESIRTLEKKYIGEADRGNHFSGRDIALKLAGLMEPDTDTAAHWREKAVHHSAQIREGWSFVTGNIEELPPCYCSDGLVWAVEDANTCLVPDGHHIILVSAHERWVFLKIFCIEEQRFKQGIIFRAPKAVPYPHVQPVGNEIWVSGSKGHVIALTLEPPEILSWHDFGDFVKEGNIVENVCVFPRAGYLWLNTREPGMGGEEICEAINIEQRRVERQFKMKGHPIIINTGSGFRIVVQDYASKSIQIFSEQGKTIDTFSLAADVSVNVATLHPNGSDYIFLSFKSHEDPYFQEIVPGDGIEEEDDDDYLLTLEKVPDIEGTCKPYIIYDSHGELGNSIYTVLNDDLIFVYFGRGSVEESTYSLAAFTPGEHGFEKLYQVELPGKLSLAADELSQKTAAINRGKGGFQVVIPGRDKPVFVDNTGNRDPGFDLSFPLFSGLMLCGAPTGAMNAAALAYMMQIRKSSPGEFNNLLLIMNQPYENDPDKIAAFINALDRSFYTDIAEDMKTRFQKRYPHHPMVLMELASDAALEWKWREVISLLEGVSLAGVDDGTARHICHLLGMALFVEGDIKRALDTWRKGAAHEGGRCNLASYITYARAALMRPKQRKKAVAENDILRSLNFIETVDAHLLNEEWPEAISLMERHDVLSSHDLQLLARFAEAFLHLRVAPGELRWFCKVVVLAYYCQKHGDKFMSNNQVFPPYIETWSGQRLIDTVSRAAQWLDLQPETEEV